MIRWRVVINDGVEWGGKNFAHGEEIVATAEAVAEISYGLEFICAV